MTEAELWDVFLGFTEVVNTTMSILITVVFAFLTAIYLVGAKLTRMQLVIIVGVYSVFFLIYLVAFSSQLLQAVEFAWEIEQVNPIRNLGVNIINWSVIVGVYLIFYAATMVFMVQIRRNAKKQLDQA